MRKVSINELSELTGKDRRTIKKHLADLAPDPDGRYDSAKALQTLYIGDHGPNYAEAMRRLAIAREKTEHEKQTKLEMENALTRRQQVSVEDVYCLYEGAFIAIRQRILASSMTDIEKEDLLKQLHHLGAEDLHKLGRDALWKEFEANRP